VADERHRGVHLRRVDAFRSYDGKGAAFGDTSVTRRRRTSGFIGVREPRVDRRVKLVLVAINKATTAKVAGIVVDLRRCTRRPACTR